MPSINIDLAFFSNRKVGRLTDILGPRAEVFLIRLWCHVGTHWPDAGGSDDWTEGEVERAAAWDGMKGELVHVLCDPATRFLHRRNKGFYVHDWETHANHLIMYKTKATKAAKARWEKAKRERECLYDPPSQDAPSNAPSMPQAMHNPCSSIANTMQCNTVTTYTSGCDSFEITTSDVYTVVVDVFREVTGRKSIDSATKEGARILALAIANGDLDPEHLRTVIKKGMSDPNLPSQTLRGVARNFGNYLPGDNEKTPDKLNAEMASCEEVVSATGDWFPVGMEERIDD